MTVHNKHHKPTGSPPSMSLWALITGHPVCGQLSPGKRGSRNLVKRKRPNDTDKPDEVTHRGRKKKKHTKCQNDEYSNMDGHGNTQLHRRLQGNSKANGTLT